MRRKIVMIMVLAVVASAATASITLGARSNRSGALNRAALAHVTGSARVPFPLPANDPRAARLTAGGYDKVWLLGTSVKRNFFQFDTASGRSCYGSGSVGATWPIGVVMCRNAAPYFPSAEKPVLDLSVVGADAGDPTLHYIRVEGIAADGVADIALRDGTGTTIGTVPVRNNVYADEHVASGVASLAARDSAGTVVAELP